MEEFILPYYCSLTILHDEHIARNACFGNGNFIIDFLCRDVSKNSCFCVFVHWPSGQI